MLSSWALKKTNGMPWFADSYGRLVLKKLAIDRHFNDINNGNTTHIYIFLNSNASIKFLSCTHDTIEMITTTSFWMKA